MRSMKLLLATAAAMGLSAAPAIAQTTASASKLSVAKSVRADTKSKGSNLAGPDLVPVVLGALAIGGGVFLAIDGSDDDDNADSN